MTPFSGKKYKTSIIEKIFLRHRDFFEKITKFFKNWKTAAKKPVKNVELWQRLDKAVAPHQVKWEWVRGHQGHIENERADQLAVAASSHRLPISIYNQFDHMLVDQPDYSWSTNTGLAPLANLSRQ